MEIQRGVNVTTLRILKRINLKCSVKNYNNMLKAISAPDSKGERRYFVFKEIFL